VYDLVYLEFAGLGIGLMVAFFLYARTRWAGTLLSPTSAVQTGATHVVQVWLANSAALAAIALGVLYLAWALGATIGLSEQAAARRTIIGSLVVNGIDAVLIVGAAVGVVMMVHRLGGLVPFCWPLAMTWVGGASLFGWGVWQTVNVLGQTALVRAAEPMPFLNLVGLLRLVVGLVIGLLTVFLLAERRASAPLPPAA
jgi:hypothetical protein